MNSGDFVKYKDDLYQILNINWSSLANRFKLKPLACSSPEKLNIFDNNIYLGNSEPIELYNGALPKYLVGERVRYDSNYYTVRFVMLQGNDYRYQIKSEEEGLGLSWAGENELY